MGRGVKTWGATKLKNETARALQLAVRMESADGNGNCRCVTCGVVKHYKQMQGGHFVGGRTNAILFDERNVHPQCVQCNHHLGGNQVAYMQFMLAKYGQEVIDAIRRNKNTPTKLSREELIDLRKSYMERVRVQRERLVEQQEDAA